MKKSIPICTRWLRRLALVVLVGSTLGLVACGGGSSQANASDGDSSVPLQEFDATGYRSTFVASAAVLLLAAFLAFITSRAQTRQAA